MGVFTMQRLRVTQLFPRSGLFFREGSLEAPLNEFLDKCAAEGYEVVKTVYAINNQTGAFTSVLVEYCIPSETDRHTEEPTQGASEKETDLAQSTRKKPGLFHRRAEKSCAPFEE